MERALYLAATAAQLAAFGLSVSVARRRHDYAPLAVYLGGEAAASWARAALVALVLVPARASAPGPLTEPAALAAVAVDGALWLLGPAGSAALAVAVFGKRRALWLVALAWLAAAIALANGYPAMRGAALGRCYLAAELAGLAASIGAFVPWVWKRTRPTLPHLAVLLILGTWGAEIAAAHGPWRSDPFTLWHVSASMQIVLFCLLLSMEVKSCFASNSS